jgi:hypothetical protein
LRKSNAINVCIVTEFFFIIKLILQCKKWQQWQLGGGSGMVVAVVVAWWQWGWGQLGDNMAADTASIGAMATAQQLWWRYQCCEVAAWQHDGGNMRTRAYKISIYKTDDNAELMEKNFGNEGEDDDTF